MKHFSVVNTNMDNTDMQIQYWAQLVGEATGTEPKPDFGKNTLQNAKAGSSDQENFEEVMKVLGDNNYEAFIQDLNQLIKLDKDGKIAKLKDAILKLFNKSTTKGASKVLTGKKVLKITDIQPTQSEVDMQKSLLYPLNKNPESCKSWFSGEPVTIKKPIVVAEVKGKHYVIDGHHRWSQVYCINPYASMQALVIKSDKLFAKPDDVLKFVQMQIFIDKKGKVLPQEKADSGYNLYTIKEAPFKKWCMKTMTDAAANELWQPMFPNGYKLDEEDHQAVAKKKAQIAAKIWKNVLVMRKHAAPIEGAHARDDMPQTGYTSDQLGNVQGKTAVKPDTYASSNESRKTESKKLVEHQQFMSFGDWLSKKCI